jgi:hypothetical protein
MKIYLCIASVLVLLWQAQGLQAPGGGGAAALAAGEEEAADKVERLPGAASLDFDLYSG